MIIHGHKYNYDNISEEHIINGYSKVFITCNYCFNNWTPTIRDHINGRCGCPTCKSSKGEWLVNQSLREMGINFSQQYKILPFPYRYDFIFEYNDVKYILEFDGIQHFSMIDFFHNNIENFTEGQHRDYEKTRLALDNGFNVIRIDYKNIKTIKSHIIKALQLKNKLYLSDRELYSHIGSLDEVFKQ